mgnify:CR=1 FL=1
MKHLTEELWFDVPTRRAFINITPQVTELVQQSGTYRRLWEREQAATQLEAA